MNPFPRPIALEVSEIAVDRFPRGKIVGQLPPRTARANDVQHGIDHLAHVMAARAPARPGRRYRRSNQSPLTARHVRWVWLPFHTSLST